MASNDLEAISVRLDGSGAEGSGDPLVIDPNELARLQAFAGARARVRVRVRIDDDDTSGHLRRVSDPLTAQVRFIDELDTEGQAFTLHFPTAQDADAFKRRVAAGALAATVLIAGAAGAATLSQPGSPASDISIQSPQQVAAISTTFDEGIADQAAQRNAEQWAADNAVRNTAPIAGSAVEQASQVARDADEGGADFAAQSNAEQWARDNTGDQGKPLTRQQELLRINEAPDPGTVVPITGTEPQAPSPKGPGERAKPF